MTTTWYVMQASLDGDEWATLGTIETESEDEEEALSLGSQFYEVEKDSLFVDQVK